MTRRIVPPSASCWPTLVVTIAPARRHHQTWSASVRSVRP